MKSENFNQYRAEVLANHQNNESTVTKSSEEIMRLTSDDRVQKLLHEYYLFLLEKNRQMSEKSQWKIVRMEVTTFDPAGKIEVTTQYTTWRVDIALHARWFSKTGGFLSSKEIEVMAGSIGDPLSLSIKVTEQGKVDFSHIGYIHDPFEPNSRSGEVSEKITTFSSLDEMLASASKANSS